MKNFKVNVKKLEEIKQENTYVNLISSDLGEMIVKKNLIGGFKTADGKKIKKITDKNFNKMRVGDLYFNFDEVENVKKR